MIRNMMMTNLITFCNRIVLLPQRLYKGLNKILSQFNNTWETKFINLLMGIAMLIYTYFCIKYFTVNISIQEISLTNYPFKLNIYTSNKFKLSLTIFFTVFFYIIALLNYFISSNVELVIFVSLGIYSIFAIRYKVLYSKRIRRNDHYIMDFLIIGTVSVTIIFIILLLVLPLSPNKDILFMNLFILSSQGFIINIRDIVSFMYYRYIAHITDCDKDDESSEPKIYYSVILSVIIRYLYLNVFIYWDLFTICIFIITLVIILLIYIISNKYLYEQFTLKLFFVFIICFTIHCISRISGIYIVNCDISYDIISYFDNSYGNSNNNGNVNGNSNINSNNNGNDNGNTLRDRPVLDLPWPVNNRPRSIIPSISNMRSSWDQVSSTLGTRNSVINRQGINHNYYRENWDRESIWNTRYRTMHLDRHNMENEVNNWTISRNRLPQPGNIQEIYTPVQAMRGNIQQSQIHTHILPIPANMQQAQTQIQPMIDNTQHRQVESIPSNTQHRYILSNASNTDHIHIQTIPGRNRNIHIQVYNPYGSNATNTDYEKEFNIWLSGPIEHSRLPSNSEIYAQRGAGIGWIKSSKPEFKVEFCHFSIDSQCLQESNTPPSSPRTNPIWKYEDVPLHMRDEIVPQPQRVPSPVRRFTIGEVWDKLHDVPVKNNYEITKERYLPHDRVPLGTRMAIYNGYILYDHINGDFSFTDHNYVDAYYRHNNN